MINTILYLNLSINKKYKNTYTNININKIIIEYINNIISVKISRIYNFIKISLSLDLVIAYTLIALPRSHFLNKLGVYLGYLNFVVLTLIYKENRTSNNK